MVVSTKLLQILAVVIIGVIIFIIFILYSSAITVFQSSRNTLPLIQSSQESFIRSRLKESESIWETSIAYRRKNEIEREHFLKTAWAEGSGRIVWDFFYPNFNCPHLIERVGYAPDGGKWICGLSKLAKNNTCLVYSFGIDGQTSFDQEILNRTQCTLRGFDHTISPDSVPMIKIYPNRSTFEKIGIGVSNNGSIRTLKSTMEHYRDTFIDILKMDIEGDEFETLPQILNDFPNGLPFGQLQIEVHGSVLPQQDMYAIMKPWWESLERAGLRAFSKEANLGSKDYSCFEIGFLNVGVDHAILHA